MFKNLLLIQLFLLLAVCTRGQNLENDLLDTRLSIDVDHASLSECFQLIESKCPVSFSYKTEFIENVKPRTVELENTMLSQVLVQLFEGTQLTYSCYHQFIILHLQEEMTESFPVQQKPETLNRPQPMASDDEPTVEVLESNSREFYQEDTLQAKHYVFIHDTIFLSEQTLKEYVPMLSLEPKPYQIFSKFSVDGGALFTRPTVLPQYTDSVLEVNAAVDHGYQVSIETCFGVERKNWSIGAGLGLHYESYGTDLSHLSISVDSTDIVEQNVIEHVSYEERARFFSYTPQGDTVWTIFYDTIRTQEVENIYGVDTVQQTYRNQNQFTYLTLPIIAQYEFQLQSSKSLSLEAGVRFHLLIRSSGYAIESEVPHQLYKLSVGTSGLRTDLLVGVSYQIYHKHRQCMAIRCRYTQSVSNLNTYSFGNIKGLSGLSFGLTYTLHRMN